MARAGTRRRLGGPGGGSARTLPAGLEPGPCLERVARRAAPHVCVSLQRGEDLVPAVGERDEEAGGRAGAAAPRAPRLDHRPGAEEGRAAREDEAEPELVADRHRAGGRQEERRRPAVEGEATALGPRELHADRERRVDRRRGLREAGDEHERGGPQHGGRDAQEHAVAARQGRGGEGAPGRAAPLAGDGRAGDRRPEREARANVRRDRALEPGGADDEPAGGADAEVGVGEGPIRQPGELADEGRGGTGPLAADAGGEERQLFVGAHARPGCKARTAPGGLGAPGAVPSPGSGQPPGGSHPGSGGGSRASRASRVGSHHRGGEALRWVPRRREVDFHPTSRRGGSCGPCTTPSPTASRSRPSGTGPGTSSRSSPISPAEVVKQLRTGALAPPRSRRGRERRGERTDVGGDPPERHRSQASGS